MEMTGTITQVFEAKGGVSAKNGNSWKSQEYLLETEEQYPKHLCFEVFGEDRIKQLNIKQGQKLTISFDIDAHEYQGRWYNQIRAWKAAAPQTDAPAAPQPQQDLFTPTPNDGGVPF